MQQHPAERDGSLKEGRSAAAAGQTRARSGLLPALASLCLVLGVLLGIFIPLMIERRREATDLANRELWIARLEDALDEQAQLLEEQELIHSENTKLRQRFLAEPPSAASDLQELQKELRVAQGVGCLLPLQGPGLEIRLSDAQGIDYATANSRQLIHDLQLRFIVDWLKVQGVQGIALNGERLVGSSRIICNGPTVQVNRVMHGMPYVIEAIAPPDLQPAELASGLGELKTVSKMREDGIIVEILTRPQMTIPAFEDQQMINENVSFLEPPAPGGVKPTSPTKSD